MHPKNHYSVFKEGNRWATQVLQMPEEIVLYYHTHPTKPEAQTDLRNQKTRVFTRKDPSKV